MAREEKAEEYANERGHEHWHFLFEENNGCPADGTCVVGLLTSKTDMLAEDWEIIKPAPLKYDF